MGFYQDISVQYGVNTVSLLKSWARDNKKLASFRNRRVFLLKCRSQGLTPRHIIDATINVRTTIQIEDEYTGTKSKGFCDRLASRILNFEITNTIRMISRLERSLTQTCDELKNIMPSATVTNFTETQKKHYIERFKSVKKTNQQKMNNLISKKNNELIKTKDTWVKNLTNIDIPGDIKSFLSLGAKFALPPSCRDISVKNMLANVENIIRILPEDRKNVNRAKITNILTNFYSKPTNHSFLDHLYLKTKKFMKDHQDLIVTRADKGNVTVILTKESYVEKCSEILNDKKYYTQIRSDPTSSFQQMANKLVSRIKNGGFVEEEVTKTLTIYNQTSPKFYGLPKIHKPTLSFRPIVSSINAPNSKLSTFITDILTRAYDDDNQYYIKDSFQFPEKTFVVC